LVILTTLTVNPYLTSQVKSSSESSSLSSDDDDDANGSVDPEVEDESAPDDSEGTDSSSDGSDDEGDGVGEEPPTLMERRGDPIPDVDVSLCGKYKYYDSKLKKCVPLPKEGIGASNTRTAATSGLINQSGLINNNNSAEGDLIIREEGTPSGPCIIITEEGTPSGPSSPQPKPGPSPKPC
jgi:hypothetical protein